jgi:hypothetical protein
MKPDYYEDFTCIADRCSFTCCREWKIGVDEDTFVKWKHTLTPNGMYDTDRGKQAKKEKLSGYVRKKDGSRVIGLNKEKNCPFLNGKKLNADMMSVTQIHQKLEKGYADIEKGNVEDAASAFVAFRERH